MNRELDRIGSPQVRKVREDSLYKYKMVVFFPKDSFTRRIARKYGGLFKWV